MGTRARITIEGYPARRAAQESAYLEEMLRGFEQRYSPTDPASEVVRVNREGFPGPVTVSPELAGMIRQSLELTRLTDGAFDITFGPLWDVWRAAAEADRLPSDKEIAAARALVGSEHIRLTADNLLSFDRPGVRINLGGIAKCRALAACAAMAYDHRLFCVLIDLGGDIAAKGTPRKGFWRVAVQDPFDPAARRMRLRVRDCLLLTSGVYQRYVSIGDRQYHHLLDARTGLPAAGIASITLLSDIGGSEPLPSAAVFLLGADRGEALARERGLGYIIVEDDGSVRRHVPPALGAVLD